MRMDSTRPVLLAFPAAALLIAVAWSQQGAAPPPNAPVAPQAQPDAPAAVSSPDTSETKEHRDARMKWWREARFGMFIHWGIYSIPAGVYNGRNIGGLGEWIQNTAKIPSAEYRKYAHSLTPRNSMPTNLSESPRTPA